VGAVDSKSRKSQMGQRSRWARLIQNQENLKWVNEAGGRG